MTTDLSPSDSQSPGHEETTLVSRVACLERQLQQLFREDSKDALAERMLDVRSEGSDEGDAFFTCGNNPALTKLVRTYGDVKVALGDGERWKPMQQRLEKLMRAYYYAQHAAFAQRQLVQAMEDIGKQPQTLAEDGDASQAEEKESPCLGLAHFCPPCEDAKATNPTQKLLLYLLQQAYHRQYRRWGDHCYREVRRPGGGSTHAWVPECSIRDFVYDMTAKEYNFDMWSCLTRMRGTVEYATTYLATCRDVQFPELKKDRKLFAFANGLYITKDGKDADGKWRDRWMPFADGEPPVSPHVVACKYFAKDLTVDLDACASYDDIPTPTLQHIMDTQQFDADVSRWIYVFLGRLLYEVNELDGWQVIPFLQGLAATGKSTVLNHVCRNFYDRNDIGVLSNNIEKKFGISAFSDKYLFIAPEVRGDLGLDQAEFQSMVSGDDMCVARKFCTAEQVEWKVPGILAGNQVPQWSDTHGSILRRLVVFDFAHKPASQDSTLSARLAEEMPNIIVKCNRAYHEAIQLVGRRNVYDRLPAFFKRTQDDIKSEVDGMRNLLDSGKLRIASDAYMLFADFTKLYNAHCRENGFKQERVNKSTYHTPFFEKAMVVKVETREWPRFSGCEVNNKFVIGAELNRADGPAGGAADYFL